MNRQTSFNFRPQFVGLIEAGQKAKVRAGKRDLTIHHILAVRGED